MYLSLRVCIPPPNLERPAAKCQAHKCGGIVLVGWAETRREIERERKKEREVLLTIKK
jgi:hypothetical protein